MIYEVHENLKHLSPPKEKQSVAEPFVDEIIVYLSQFSGGQLADFAHSSEPWIVSKRQHSLSLTNEVIKEHWGRSDFEKTLIETVEVGIEKGQQQQQNIDAQKQFYSPLK